MSSTNDSTAYSRSPMTSTASYDSPVVSSAPSPTPPGAYGGGLMGASPRPISGQRPHHINVPPAPSIQSSYQSSYNPATTSPGTGGIDAMASPASSSGTPGSVPSQLSGNLQAQKRAYRQRRKDPSCDACRERKVKCDATETTSCSECSSRNVKCQFTKETNRRMSSIKQVQDLEKQVSQVKRENAHLRSLMNMREGQMDIDSNRTPNTTFVLPEVGSHPKRRQRPAQPYDFSHVRANLRNHVRGIFKPPAPYRQVGSQSHFSPHQPELPSKHISDHLLRSYYASVHTVIPILHWPTFKQEYEDVYHSGSLQRVSPVWTSLFFAVLAVGVLFSTENSAQRPQKGKEYIETSRILIDLWNDEFVIDHARTAVLTSIFLTEMNLKSAAWTWLASSVRISQDIGLHFETGPWHTIEGEMRRRVWWGIYAWDRLISLELCRPLLIEDGDCDVSLPAAIDDHYIHDGGVLVPNGAHPLTNLLLPTIHVVRSMSQLIKTLKSVTIAPTTLATFDTHFRTCMAAFPPSFQLDSRNPLDPSTLSPIIYLMNARIILHRHNLSTSCTPDVRANAIEHCLRASLDTTHLIARAMHSSSHPSSNSMPPFGPTASTMLATHIWRCTLFLLFCSHYESALTLIRASATIGSFREVNIACGRNLSFFLSVLHEKRRVGSLTSNINDEELMAYVSGDMQANTENGWVWQGSETGMALNQIAGSGSPGSGQSLSSSFLPAGTSTSMALSEKDRFDWGGWERLEYLVSLLMREGPIHAQTVPTDREYGHTQAYAYPSLERGFGAQTPVPPARAEPKSRTSDNRLSIANII